jgi:hypothetical protein
MDDNDRQTMIAAGRASAGKSTAEILAECNAATGQFGKNTASHFGRRGEFGVLASDLEISEAQCAICGLEYTDLESNKGVHWTHSPDHGGLTVDRHLDCLVIPVNPQDASRLNDSNLIAGPVKQLEGVIVLPRVQRRRSKRIGPRYVIPTSDRPFNGIVPSVVAQK